MDFDKFLKEVKEGKRTVLIFTQDKCKHCKQLIETIQDMGITAYEVPVDKQVADAHDLTVTPTLITYTEDQIGRVHGSRKPEALREWIKKL